MNIYNQIHDPTQRLALFASVAERSTHFNGKPIFHNQIYSTPVKEELITFAKSGNGLFARSQVKRIRLERYLQSNHSYVAVAPVIDKSLPATRPHRDAEHVVILAPEEDAMKPAIYAFALSQVKKPAIFVCKGRIAGTPHHFIDTERAADALANATVVVDTRISDPGCAVAFAGRGFGLASSFTTSAQEYAQGLASYKMHDFTSIAKAMARASTDRRKRNGCCIGDSFNATSPTIDSETFVTFMRNSYP